MILGWFPEMLIGGVTYGLGRSYNKPWARVVGGGIMIVSTVYTVAMVALVASAAKAGTARTSAPIVAGDPSLFR